jgi:hypothetical protein
MAQWNHKICRFFSIPPSSVGDFAIRNGGCTMTDCGFTMKIGGLCGFTMKNMGFN